MKKCAETVPASSTTLNFWTGAVSRKVPGVKRFKSCAPTFLTVAMTSAAFPAGARVTSKPSSRLPFSMTAASPKADRMERVAIAGVKRILKE